MDASQKHAGMTSIRAVSVNERYGGLRNTIPLTDVRGSDWPAVNLYIQ